MTTRISCKCISNNWRMYAECRAGDSLNFVCWTQWLKYETRNHKTDMRYLIDWWSQMKNRSSNRNPRMLLSIIRSTTLSELSYSCLRQYRRGQRKAVLILLNLFYLPMTLTYFILGKNLYTVFDNLNYTIG